MGKGPDPIVPQGYAIYNEMNFQSFMKIQNQTITLRNKFRF